jgi:hypothetical protein
MTATDSSHLEPDIHDSETGPTQQTDTSGDASESPLSTRNPPLQLHCGGSVDQRVRVWRGRLRRSGRERLG